MSKMPNGSRFDLSDLDLDYVDPPPVGPAIYKMPSQLRGERFDQPQRATYIFKNGGLSLCVFHQQRLIIAEVDVSTVESVCADWPSLSKDRSAFANQLLPGLRARLGRHRQPGCQIQGPFIPHEHGIAIATLLIHVGLDSNFDDVYQIAKRFLELHPDNEDVERFKKAWAAPKRQLAQSGRRENHFHWTNEELRAVESMAPLEPPAGAFGFDRTEEERIRFNEIVWRQCQQRIGHVRQGSLDDENIEASSAANRLLGSFLNSY